MKIVCIILLCSIFLYSQTPFVDQSSALKIPLTVHGNHGVAVVDFNKDGWDDIFFANIGQISGGDTTFCTLLRNNQNGTFTNVTRTAGLALYGSFKCGVWGDINNDGFPDLFLAESQGVGRCHLLMNNKDGTFRDISSDCGINFAATIATAAFGDVDNDGKIDLFLASEYPQFDLLYKNISKNDTILFQDVSSTSGIEGFSSTTPMQATFIDIDHDGDLDLYAVHDGFLPSSLYRNNNNGTFTDISAQTGLNDFGVGNSMGVYWNDYDNDGWEEVYVSRIGKGGLYKRQINGTYQNIADSSGAELNGMSWGVVWEDFDNDMDDDMFLVNTYNFNSQKSLYFENIDGKFVNKAPEYGVDLGFDFYGLAYGDFNNDGYLDLVASANDGNNKLLMNSTNRKGNWLELSLTGTTINSMAIGAKIRIVAGGKNQSRTRTAGNSYASEMSSMLHFGIGSLTFIDTLEVTWSKNNIQVFTNIAVNKQYQLIEGGTLTTITRRTEESTQPSKFSLQQNYPNPFNPSTTIAFSIPERMFVSLKVYDVAGREIATLVHSDMQGGKYSRQWNADGISGGIYFYRLTAGVYTATKKIVLLK